MAGHDALTSWALYLAEMGWHVFPVAVGAKKPPVIRQWETRATTDTDRIARCWGSDAYNIGIATGPSRLVVVDLDTAKPETDGVDGADALTAFMADRGVQLPDTYTVGTPSGGLHRYYTAPKGVHLRNTHGDIAERVDTRAEGGYVVGPGSLVARGGYELVDDRDPAQLPAWLVQACLERPNRTPVSPTHIQPGRVTAYASAAIRGETTRVRNAESGAHNEVLSRAGYRLGQLVGGRLLGYDVARQALLEAGQGLIAADCECTPREVERVVTASLSAGMEHPRTCIRDDAA